MRVAAVYNAKNCVQNGVVTRPRSGRVAPRTSAEKSGVESNEREFDSKDDERDNDIDRRQEEVMGLPRWVQQLSMSRVTKNMNRLLHQLLVFMENIVECRWPKGTKGSVRVIYDRAVMEEEDLKGLRGFVIDRASDETLFPLTHSAVTAVLRKIDPDLSRHSLKKDGITQLPLRAAV